MRRGAKDKYADYKTVREEKIKTLYIINACAQKIWHLEPIQDVTTLHGFVAHWTLHKTNCKQLMGRKRS